MQLRIILVLVLFPGWVGSQNLINNPGFEKKSGCPESAGQLQRVSRWFTANTGTPDYFNDCSTNLEYGTEFNKKGGQLPHSGHGYIGLQSYIMNQNEFFEYAETLLDSALTADMWYCLSVWVACGKADYAFSEIGAVLSRNEIRLAQPGRIMIPYIPLRAVGYLDNQESWTCLKAQFRAKGGERFITIGHFSKNDDFWNIQLGSRTDSTFKDAYYFIDDINFGIIQDSAACACVSFADQE